MFQHLQVQTVRRINNGDDLFSKDIRKVTLDDLDDRTLANNDPRLFLKRMDGL